MPLSPIDLYQKCKATDTKALVSIQRLAALKIHLGGDRTISENALTQFLHNLTFQALSKENDKVFLSFKNIGNLVLDILGNFAKIEQQLVEDSKTCSKNLKQELDKTEFDLGLLSELGIQKKLAKYRKEKKKPPKLTLRSSSTPLKTKEINKLYNEAKEDYLPTAMTINKTDSDAAVENPGEKN